MPIERLWLHAKQYWRKKMVHFKNFKNKALIREKIEECIRDVPSQYLGKYVKECAKKM